MTSPQAFGPLAQARADHGRLLRESLDRLVETLSALPEVTRVSLHGSYARGRADLFTDLDVIVVMQTEESFLERQRRLYGLLALPVDVDLLCYTPTELERMKERPFFRHLFRDEVILYEKKLD